MSHDNWTVLLALLFVLSPFILIAISSCFEDWDDHYWGGPDPDLAPPAQEPTPKAAVLPEARVLRRASAPCPVSPTSRPED